MLFIFYRKRKRARNIISEVHKYLYVFFLSSHNLEFSNIYENILEYLNIITNSNSTIIII